MKTHKKSEFKLDPITGEIISSSTTGNKKNNTQKDGMYPKNKIIEDHEFFEVIGKNEKFPNTDFIKLKSFQYGTEINLKTYKYPANKIKGIVYLFHGLFEYADRNAYLAKILSENGYEVLSLDYRGHGRSDGIRGHIDGFNCNINIRF